MNKILTLLYLICLGLKAQEQPNIIICMVDDLGWNQMSTNAITDGTQDPAFYTPNLDKMAQNGMSFTNVYSQPNCAPSRAAIITGQYPARPTNDVYCVGNLNRHGRGLKTGNGISREEAQFLGPEQHTDVSPDGIIIAKALKKNGYATAHIGKYHVGGSNRAKASLPENVGFDINVGGFKQGHQPNCFASKKADGSWEFKGVGLGHFDKYAKPYTVEYLKKHDFQQSLAGTAKHICDAVADAMESTLAQLTKQDQPFYLQLHPYSVHAPINARPDFLDKARKRIKTTKSNRARRPSAALVGFIEGMDSIVGRLMKAVEDPNGDGDKSDSIAKNTIILFTSDNGGPHYNNEPLRGIKGMFTEGGIRVPLLAQWPGVIPAGSSYKQMLHFVDFYPTYLELAGNKWSPNSDEHTLDGFSFAKQLKDPTINLKRKPIFFLFPGYMDSRAQPCATIIEEIGNKRYKLFYDYENNSYQLYNLTEDASEKNNLIKAQPELAQSMSKKLNQWLTKQESSWKPKFPIDKNTGKSVGPPPLL